MAGGSFAAPFVGRFLLILGIFVVVHVGPARARLVKIVDEKTLFQQSANLHGVFPWGAPALVHGAGVQCNGLPQRFTLLHMYM